LRSSLLRCCRCVLRRIERDWLRERKKSWQIADDLSGSLRLSLQRIDLCERVLERGGAIVFARIGCVECLFLGRDRCLQAQAIITLCKPSMESHRGEKHGEKNAGDLKCISHGNGSSPVIRDL
jgi:hypothetical protein